jgi:hypothetical protein
MATITVKDLSENLELDRKAMQAIAGGSRLSPSAGAFGKRPMQEQRLVDFRTGVAAGQMPRGKTGA